MSRHPTVSLNVDRPIQGRIQTPTGTPIKPATSIGASLRQSMAAQTAGSEARWPATEAADTSWAATSGSTACSHSGSAVNPVPKPVSPLTKPPTSAPARMKASALHSP